VGVVTCHIVGRHRMPKINEADDTSLSALHCHECRTHVPFWRLKRRLRARAALRDGSNVATTCTK
jgi:hypothetical protein